MKSFPPHTYLNFRNKIRLLPANLSFHFDLISSHDSYLQPAIKFWCHFLENSPKLTFFLCLHCQAPLWELTGLHTLKIKVISSLLLTSPNFLFSCSPCTKYHPVGPWAGCVHRAPDKDLIPSFLDTAVKLSPGWIPTKWPNFSCASWNPLLRSHSNNHRKLVIAAKVANCAHCYLWATTCVQNCFSLITLLYYFSYSSSLLTFFFIYNICIFIAYNTDIHIFICVCIYLYIYIDIDIKW